MHADCYDIGTSYAVVRLSIMEGLVYMQSLCRLGPLINFWCMRMEGENSYFKQVARIGNFKNISYSIARRHQRLLCAYLQGNFFTYDDIHCGPCKLNAAKLP